MARSKFLMAIAYLLSVFYVFGAYSNAFPSDAIAANYARWGYPSWFHIITAGLELAVAALLIPAATRFWGAVLGTLVMTAALATLVINGLAAHGLPALVVFVASAAVAVASTQNQGAIVTRVAKLFKPCPKAASSKA